MSNLEYYNKHAEQFHQSTKDVDMSALYQEFLRRLPTSARILDAGCGSGRDSLAFIQHGYDVQAMDASEELAKLASAHLGQPVLAMAFDEIQWADEFDGIWCCASLLHVPRAEQANIAAKLNRSLKSGGVIYASYKYGGQEREQEGRFFTDMNEELIDTVFCPASGFINQKSWLTADVRVGREAEKWINIIAVKT